MGEKLIVIVKTLRSQMGLPAQLSKHSYHTTKKNPCQQVQHDISAGISVCPTQVENSKIMI